MGSKPKEPRILSQDEEAFISKLPYKVIPTNLPGVYANPPLPNDFDHERATQEDLTQHGLMFRKPHPQHSPKAYEAYHRIFHNTPLQKDYVVPVSKPHVGVKHPLNVERLRVVSRSNRINQQWAGAYQATKKYWGIYGTWRVPVVTPAPEHVFPNGWTSSSFIGIGGIVSSSFSTYDWLRIGVRQNVDPNGVPHYFAFYQWSVRATLEEQNTLPAYIHETEILNFPVSAGHEMNCSVTYQLGRRPTPANFGAINTTTGQHFSITLAPPSPPSRRASDDGFSGSVEWIMESSDPFDFLATLPHFTPVNFTFCGACSSDDSSQIHPSDCNTLNLEAVSGGVITSVTTSGDSLSISNTV